MGFYTDNSLLMQCARSIKRWPRLDAKSFPELPGGCFFTVCGLGGVNSYNLWVGERLFCKEDINKMKKLDAKNNIAY